MADESKLKEQAREYSVNYISYLSDPYERQIEVMAAFARERVEAETADLRARLADAKEAIRKLDAAMDMQEKRETEEFHIPQHTARDIWDTARQAGRDSLAKLQENK